MMNNLPEYLEPLKPYLHKQTRNYVEYRLPFQIPDLMNPRTGLREWVADNIQKLRADFGKLEARNVPKNYPIEKHIYIGQGKDKQIIETYLIPPRYTVLKFNFK